MTTIEKGSKIVIHTAIGETLSRRAASGVVDGADFPVVWVATEEDWIEAVSTGDEPVALPWPAEDVEPAEDVNQTAYRVVDEATNKN